MNGNEIGLNVDEIGLQTGDEIYRLIAAYAEVDEFKIRVGMLAADILRSVEGVARAQLVRVGAVAPCVGD